MKITFLCPHLRIAGGVRAILIHADRLARRGHEVFATARRVETLDGAMWSLAGGSLSCCHARSALLRRSLLTAA